MGHSETHTSVTNCRVCNGTSLTKYLDLGQMPLVNRVLDSPDQQESRFPLEVLFCNDCSLSQLSVVVNPELMFSHYVYRSSMSSTFRAHCGGIAEQARAERGLQDKDLVIDIASNDGCMLREFKNRYDVLVLGVDPAKNLAAEATANNIPTIPEFWSPALAESITHDNVQAKIITATNVFAHVDDLGSFIEGVKIALHPQGTFIVEVPYLVDLLKTNVFDTVYHEHVSYFPLTPIHKAFEKKGMHVNHVERVDIHGGSLRVFAGHGSESDGTLETMLGQEERKGFLSLDGYEYGMLQKNANRIREDMQDFLGYQRKHGHKVAGFSASAKGTVMLNYAQSTPDDVAYVVDGSKDKQHKFMAGTRIPILPKSAFRDQAPDYMLVLAWNIFKEARAESPWFEPQGGRWVMPVPYLHIE
jgi:SAM-dependent methyltransferase